MKQTFLYAFRRTVPIMLGFFPLGLAYGVLMESIGYNFLWSTLTSLTVLAGSLQFLMVEFFVNGTPLITVALLALLHVHLPSPVIDFAGLIGNANAPMAMLMLGVGFKISGDGSQIHSIVKILSVRYAVAIAVALGCYFLLPAALETRQTLALLAFSPIASAAPAFTGELGGDSGLASAVNSLSIVISLVCIVAVLLLIL